MSDKKNNKIHKVPANPKIFRNYLWNGFVVSFNRRFRYGQVLIKLYSINLDPKYIAYPIMKVESHNI